MLHFHTFRNIFYNWIYYSCKFFFFFLSFHSILSPTPLKCSLFLLNILAVCTPLTFFFFIFIIFMILYEEFSAERITLTSIDKDFFFFGAMSCLIFYARLEALLKRNENNNFFGGRGRAGGRAWMGEETFFVHFCLRLNFLFKSCDWGFFFLRQQYLNALRLNSTARTCITRLRFSSKRSMRVRFDFLLYIFVRSIAAVSILSLFRRDFFQVSPRIVDWNLLFASELGKWKNAYWLFTFSNICSLLYVLAEERILKLLIIIRLR